MERLGKQRGLQEQLCFGFIQLQDKWLGGLSPVCVLWPVQTWVDPSWLSLSLCTMPPALLLQWLHITQGGRQAES